MVYPSVRIARGQLTLRLVEGWWRSSDQPALFISLCRSSAKQSCVVVFPRLMVPPKGREGKGRGGGGGSSLKGKQAPKISAKETDDFQVNWSGAPAATFPTEPASSCCPARKYVIKLDVKALPRARILSLSDASVRQQNHGK